MTVGPHDMRARGCGRGQALLVPRAWMSRTELLDGCVIQSIERHGKRLALCATDGRCLVVQLGMSGQLIAGACAGGSHQHVTWSMTDASPRRTVRAKFALLVFRDPRRFGGLTPYQTKKELHESWKAELGPDALAVQARALRIALRGARAVKTALLDQTVVAGVGNIYADESLHIAGIDPRITCDQVSESEIQRLTRAIRLILRRAVKHGGSTLRDYRSGIGIKGAAQALHAVYGHAGESCGSCSETLHGTRLGGRATVWCPRCQPGTRTKRSAV